jgi:hypothetical protein
MIDYFTIGCDDDEADDADDDVFLSNVVKLIVDDCVVDAKVELLDDDVFALVLSDDVLIVVVSDPVMR